jgi:hypothetical protein
MEREVVAGFTVGAPGGRAQACRVRLGAQGWAIILPADRDELLAEGPWDPAAHCFVQVWWNRATRHLHAEDVRIIHAATVALHAVLATCPRARAPSGSWCPPPPLPRVVPG